MTVIVKHNKTNTITDWTQAQLDEQIALGNFAPGTTLANIVLPSDWNNDHTLTGVGTMAEQDATAVAITGGTINNTTIGATTATTGKFTSVTTPSVTATTNDLTLSAISTGAVKLNTAGGTQFQINNTASATAWGQITGSTVSSFAGTIEFSSASTVSGSDAISINYATQQIGNHAFKTGVSKLTQLNITGVASVVNYHNFVGSATTKAPIYSVAGSDTNISMAFQPKGTGAINLAAGSSGVNISNGGTVTAVTLTNAGTGYTSFPTATISVPTTAGGVQGVVSFTRMYPSGYTIGSGGTGYTVGNVLTIVGGTPVTTAAQLTVSSVSGGVITAVTVSAANSYTVLPTNPVSVTGGSGTGATFNLTYSLGAATTISNAGSGYIEQPTITFSGGGGSGAAAYAIVGSGTIIRSLANTLDIHTPAGSGFQVNNASGSTLIYSKGVTGYGGFLASSITGNSAFYFGYVNNAEVGRISMTSSNNLSFGTSSAASEQLRVSHTASAVNYVQVTGAATSGTPTISAQGSDANVSITIASKNVADARLQSNGGNVALLTDSGLTALRAIPRVASGDTFLDVQRAVGFIDLIASSSVTDGDIRFTPKGAGNVRFGTYTGTILTPTGFITIKDSGGTTRRLLVG
jgi:hypothetical protein